MDTLPDRIRHVMQVRVQRQAHRRLLGRRGQGHGGPAGGDPPDPRWRRLGSIIGRNSFQRPKGEALELLGRVLDIYLRRS